MKSWKKTKRERRKIKILKGKLVNVRITGFPPGELLKLKKLAKSMGMSSVSELVKHALKHAMLRDKQAVWSIPEELQDKEYE